MGRGSDNGICRILWYHNLILVGLAEINECHLLCNYNQQARSHYRNRY
ncbi:hypothetical protein HanXRQr2_Chr02g0046311 [Helianthus annuus]|uniref:Uncharacterized protein n=1 Tax=Helianthus annuus TaxID=4232 RepID=A0A9K3NZF4_HELAN|nr:hypothetical protein HanXRQr2_Chr02g0046311 [Helianthus annuus]KAJ0950241.1 hypothetical protein HanPSC8_Chr02g0045931 [Helianthus annuus]